MSYSYQQDAVFCKIVPFVLHVEGGFVDDPKDPGGPTKFGIAYNFNAGALHKVGITRDTVCNLTLDQAKEIYYARYALASGTNDISDDGLALMHLDCAVNCGVGAARKMLAELSVNPKYFDGRGNRNSALFYMLILEYVVLRIDYYTTKIRKNLRDRYLEGWMNRLKFVIKKAKELV